ncbi:MAG: leucine-rich repeat domain-containing protein [Clostridia bacterium]|nr:leucine-rich repeat domain-containing protein [Clostridia bacterium]
MKKKIILMLAIMTMLMCVFAFSVSAEDAFVLTSDIGDKQAGETIPLYDGEKGLVWYLNDENKLVSVKTSELTLEFTAQDQQYTQIGNLPAVNGAQCLSAIKVGEKVIQSLDAEKKIVVANLKDLSFEYIYTSGTTTVFANNDTLQCVYLPNTVKRLANYSFYNCVALTNIDMGNGVQIIWDYVFAGATALERVDYSNTCLYTGSYVFKNATSLKELHLGKSMQHLPMRWMDGTGKQQIDIYIPPTVSAFAAPYNDYLTIFFTGSLEQAKKSLPTFNVVNYTYIPYSEYAGLHTTESLKWVAYYDVSDCDAYYKGVHTGSDDGDCTTAISCDVCQSIITPAYDKHDNKISVTYENGYMENGCKKTGCSRCMSYVELELDPLFTCLGYSAPENGNGGIAIGFTVNNEAIAEYEEVTGKTLKYGVFAVLQSRLGNNDVFAEGGTVADGVINAEITNYEFVAFELKIVGFTDNQKDTKLAMGAYVAVTDGETTEYSYMQGGEPDENEKYCFVSYNDIVGTPSTNEEVSQ